MLTGQQLIKGQYNKQQNILMVFFFNYNYQANLFIFLLRCVYILVGDYFQLLKLIIPLGLSFC